MQAHLIIAVTGALTDFQGVRASKLMRLYKCPRLFNVIPLLARRFRAIFTAHS
jgi:hypothetical protein